MVECKYLPNITKTQTGFAPKNSNRNERIVLNNHNNNLIPHYRDPALISNNFISTKNDFLKQRNINKNDLYSTNRVGNFYNENKNKLMLNESINEFNSLKTSNKFINNTTKLNYTNKSNNLSNIFDKYKNFNDSNKFKNTNFSNQKMNQMNNKLALLNAKNTSVNSLNENSNSFKYDNSSIIDKSKKYNTQNNMSLYGSNLNTNKSLKKTNKNKNDLLSKDLNNLIKTVYDYDESYSLQKNKKNLKKITEENNASNYNLNGSSSLENSVNQKIKLSLMERYMVCTDYSMRLNYKMK